MVVYAVGDIQGCAASLRRLLKHIDFTPRVDQLWLVGDLVNRGPDSLGVLRWMREHQDCVRSVLGNHDVHLLASAAGRRKLHRRDTLEQVLNAPDAPELLEWLRQRPFLDEHAGHALLHAGLLPSWTWALARELAQELQAALLHAEGAALWEALEISTPERWTPELRGAERLAAALQGFTRLRTCHSDDTLCSEFKGPPNDAPPGCVPWFEQPGAAWRDGPRVLFGHWAALGLHHTSEVVGLDTGCVWGGSLSALRLDDNTIHSVPTERTDVPRTA